MMLKIFYKYIGVFLFWISAIILIITFPLGMFFTRIKTNEEEWNDFNMNLAITIDKLGNVLLAKIFNNYLINKQGYRFGNRLETISSVLGKNQLNNTLTSLGKKLVDFLDKLDKNHCLNSIDYSL